MSHKNSEMFNEIATLENWSANRENTILLQFIDTLEGDFEEVFAKFVNQRRGIGSSLEYYNQCRLEISWWNESKFVTEFDSKDISGSFESDPMTVANVWKALLAEDVAVFIEVTDHDGGLEIDRPLTLEEVEDLARQQKEAIAFIGA